MSHHTFFGSFLLCLAFFSSNLFFSYDSFADDDSLLDRNRHAGRRSSKFYVKNFRTRHFASLSAEYDSDEDSKQKIIQLDHFYKSKNLISDTEITIDTVYEIQRPRDSKDKKKHLIKERDLLKIITSQKLLINKSNNYFIFFNESRHDNEYDYSYRDVVTSIGLGKSFANQMVEFDISVGQATGRNITDSTHESVRKNYKRKVVIPSFRFEKRVNRKIRFVSRGYFYSSEEMKSFYNISKVQIRIDKSIFLQISHLFDQRNFDLFNKKTHKFKKKVNETRRQIVFGLRFEL